MFRSHESGRGDFVTLIADYLPLQDAYGGPNYFKLDPDALYEIHVDNDGDAREDLSFQFRFRNTLADVQVPIGEKMLSIPLKDGCRLRGLRGEARLRRQHPRLGRPGRVFDAPAAVLTDPTKTDAPRDDLADRNLTTLALEVDEGCLTAGDEPVIGGWTSAGLRQGRLLSGTPRAGYQTSASTPGPGCRCRAWARRGSTSS